VAYRVLKRVVEQMRQRWRSRPVFTDVCTPARPQWDGCANRARPEQWRRCLRDTLAENSIGFPHGCPRSASDVITPSHGPSSLVDVHARLIRHDCGSICRLMRRSRITQLITVTNRFQWSNSGWKAKSRPACARELPRSSSDFIPKPMLSKWQTDRPCRHRHLQVLPPTTVRESMTSNPFDTQGRFRIPGTDRMEGADLP
jgi:hypothetical protein